MITPAFELSQDPDFLTLLIRVPYTRMSELDIYIDGEDFKFYAKPYFLRLTLPGRIVQDGRETASFDIDKGLFTMKVPKETAGQHFEGLQMLTSLLAPKGSRSAKPLVEEIGACGGSETIPCDDDNEDEEDEEEFDWQIEQQPFVEALEEDLKQLQRYGFGNLRTGVFSRLQEELSELIDVKDPEKLTAAQRRTNRIDSESSIFCSDHYLLDLYEGDEMRQVHLNFKPWWSELQSNADDESVVTFSGEEKEQMRKFTNRSYVLDKAARQHVWLSLVDLILTYVYDVRTTEGEHNVESAWTIRKLSGTLSWLETYTSLQEVLVSFGRRVLCYPLYRHFSLITTAIQDAACIFRGGKACVLKCLLAIHKIFREHEPAYILNDLYITDYCVWIQRVKSKQMLTLAEALQTAELHKNDLDLELLVLEQAAELVLEEEEEAKRCESVKNAEEKSSSSKEEESSSSSSDEEESSSSEGEESSSSSSSSDEEESSSSDEEQGNKSTEAKPVMVKESGSEIKLIQELGDELEEKSVEDMPQLREGDTGGPGKAEKTTPALSEGQITIASISTTLLETLRIVDTEEVDSDDENKPNPSASAQ